MEIVEGTYLPHWTDLPEAAIAVREVIKCGCDSEKRCRNMKVYRSRIEMDRAVQMQRLL